MKIRSKKKDSKLYRKQKQLYLKGAYGPGNLGDDVLLLVMISILQEVVSAEDISIGVSNPQLAKKLGGRINWLPLEAPADADVLIYGGGGQFFSFPVTSSFKTKAVSRVGRAISILKGRFPLKQELLRQFYKIRSGNKIGVVAKNVGIYCVGVGPFEGGRVEERYARAVFDRADFVSVRDKRSFELAQGFTKTKVFLESDLSLLLSRWAHGAGLATRNCVEGKKVGVIVRRWPHDERGKRALRVLKEAARALELQGVGVEFISFYREYDKAIIEEDGGRYRWRLWAPDTQHPREFLEDIANNCFLVISMRAHGMILPALFGVPSIGVAIEPKIRDIKNMFPNGTELFDPGQTANELVALVSSMKANLNNYKKSLEMEVARETEKIDVERFISWLIKAIGCNDVD